MRLANILMKVQIFVVSLIGAKLIITFTFYVADAFLRFLNRRRREEALGMPILRYMGHSLSGLAKVICYLIGGPYDVVAKSVREVAETCIDICCLFGFVQGVHDGAFMEACNSEVNDAFYVKPTGKQAHWDTLTPDAKSRFLAQEKLVAESCEILQLDDTKSTDWINDADPFVGAPALYFFCHRADFPYMNDYCSFYDHLNDGPNKALADRKCLMKEMHQLLREFSAQNQHKGVFVFAIEGENGVAVRRDIAYADLQKYEDSVARWATPTVVAMSGEAVTKSSLKFVPLPTWGGVDLPDIGKHWANTTMSQKYKYFCERATKCYDRVKEHVKEKKWMVPIFVFGIAFCYLLYHVWKKKSERKVRIQPLGELNQSDDFISNENQTPTPEMDKEHKVKGGRRRELGNRDRIHGHGPSHHIGKDSRNRRGRMQASDVNDILKKQQQLLKKDEPICLRCLNSWTCKIDEVKHNDKKYCIKPDIDYLKRIAVDDYKEYINQAVRECVCGKCNEDVQHDRRVASYNADKVRLGLAKRASRNQSLVLHEIVAKDGGQLRRYVSPMDDDYLLIPEDDCIESKEPVLQSWTPNCNQSATFNHISLDSNALFSVFMVEVSCRVAAIASDEQWALENHKSRAHGFRSGVGYQTVRHLFGDHTKIQLQRFVVHFYQADVGMVTVDVPEVDLKILSDHYNRCASGASPAFMSLDLWCIPQKEWALSVGKHMPMREDVGARYELSTVTLYSNQDYKNALGVIPRFKLSTVGTWVVDFAPFCMQSVELDAEFVDSKFRVGVYWADTVGGDSGCLIMVSGAAMCQHLRTGAEPDGRVCGRFLDEVAKSALRIQVEPKLVNSC
jgi:hypothetical protein